MNGAVIVYLIFFGSLHLLLFFLLVSVFFLYKLILIVYGCVFILCLFLLSFSTEKEKDLKRNMFKIHKR